MSLGPRARKALLTHQDPQRAQRVEEQRRRGLAIMKQREREQEEATILFQQEQSRLQAEQERIAAEKRRTELIRAIKLFHLEDLDSFTQHHYGDPVLSLDHLAALGLVPEAVFDMADDPNQVRGLMLSAGRYDCDIMILERNCRDQHRWDQDDLRIFRAANTSNVEYALDRKRLSTFDRPMQRIQLSKMYPAQAVTPMLIIEKYADRAFAPEVRVRVLAELSRLQELGFQDRMIVKPFELKTALHVEHSGLITNLSTMTWQERRRRGLPDHHEYDHDYAISAERLSVLLSDFT